MSEPKFYNKNVLSSTSQLSGSYVSGSSTLSRLFDRGDSIQWASVGANGDWIPIDMRVSVNAGTVISTIVVKNHNFVSGGTGFSFSWWNGSSWANFSNESRTIVTDTFGKVHTIVTFTAQALQTTGVLLYFQSTGTHDEKRIGEIIMTDVNFVGPDFASYDPRWREKTKDVVLGDGSLHRVYTKDEAGRTGKYEASAKFTYLTKQQRDNLKSLKDSATHFIVQPESVTNPEEFYTVHWANAWDEKYMSSYKGAGYEVALNLREV